MAKWSFAIGALVLAILAGGAFVTQMYVSGYDRLLGMCQTACVAGLVALGFLWQRRINATEATGDLMAVAPLAHQADAMGDAGASGDGST